MSVYVAGGKVVRNAAGQMLGKTAGGTSDLAVLAASMSSGGWSNFTMGGMSTSFVDVGGGHSVVEFCARGHWDPVHKKIQFWGQGHTQDEKLITWDDATNQWSQGVDPGLAPGAVGHAYYHQALDPATGDLYLREYSSPRVRKLAYGGGSWVRIADCNNSANQVAGGLEWLAGLNGGAGGLAFIDFSAIETWNPVGDTWTIRSSSLSSMGLYHNWIAAGGGSIWGGGGNGSTRMYKMTAAGTVTTSTDTPIQAGIWAEASDGKAPVISHPNGSDLLQFASGATGAIHSWNGSSWSNIGTHSIGGTSSAWFAVPVSDYGVVVFVTQELPSTGTVVCRVYKP